ncbi:zinc finger protein 449-like isoform X2 [Danaus plexippus]|uniref:zinc finger protein 449-like isoform X2 n=1 Tax=Danaus plexippus TaxID=13037 RepID=UPI002AAF3E27|nr:zinc finger protein 449-like isoform X2 [Danaus plexippus]
MRTYKRKRPEYTFIEGVHELCRLCLEKATESVPIFSNESNIYASLSVRIMMCVGFEVSREDCLPNSICSTCHKQLSSFYEFRKKCAVMYQKLKCHVLAVKQMESEKALKQIQENNITKAFESDTGRHVQNHGTVDASNETQIISDSVSLIKNTITENIEEAPDISDFLSSILLEIGILTKQDGQVVSKEHLEMIDIDSGADRVTFQLLEVDEGQKSSDIIKDSANSELLNVRNVNILEKELLRPINSVPRCTECGKSYATRGALRRHARVHTGERPHVCHVCSRAFGQKEVLRRHELVHTEDRPFKCQNCPKSFTQRGALLSHGRACLPPPAARPLALHRCTVCPKVFLHASGLSRHALVHAGRVFSCSPCGRRYSDRSSLLRHLRSHKHARTHTDTRRDAHTDDATALTVTG